MNVKETIQKIANILLINSDDVSNDGLLNGNMGLAIFFYNYSKYTQIIEYKNIADDLIDKIIKNLNVYMGFGMGDGLTGICLGIRYLKENNFITGDIEEALKEVDKNIFKYSDINDISKNPLVSEPGIYLSYLLKNEKNLLKYNDIILSRLKIYDKNFHKIIKMKNPLEFINSILFLFLKIRNINNGCYFSYINKTILKILSYINSFEDLSVFKYSDIKTMTIFFTELSNLYPKMPIKAKLQSLFKESNTRKATQNDLISYLWQNLLYFPIEKVHIDLDEVNDYIDEVFVLPFYETNFSIQNGLSSIGLSLMKQEKN